MRVRPPTPEEVRIAEVSEVALPFNAIYALLDELLEDDDEEQEEER